MAWEQAQLDEVVGDIFGFHALQLGWPAVQALRANRMPHRWLVSDGHEDHSLTDALDLPAEPPRVELGGGAAALLPSVLADYDALPFASNSIDLVVLPHTLEFARDPHHALREVERVLVPEGRVVVLGFNPASLWGLRQRSGVIGSRLGLGQPFVPPETEFIGWRRLRDWLRLLSFEVEGGRFGCYRPAMNTDRWMDRLAWMDSAGQRWWPVFGSAYVLVAVKRVRGMRVVGKIKRSRAPAAAAPAVVTGRWQRRNTPMNNKMNNESQGS